MIESRHGGHDGDHGFRIVGSKRVYEADLVCVDLIDVESPRGVNFQREVVRHPGAVAVLPVFNGESALLLSQYRAPIDEVILEVPAGKLERGETPTECGARELREETGLRAEKLIHLATFVTTPGFSDEILHAYVAECGTPPEYIGATEPDGEEERDLTMSIHTLSTWPALVESSAVKDAKTIICLALAAQRFEQDARQR